MIWQHHIKPVKFNIYGCQRSDILKKSFERKSCNIIECIKNIYYGKLLIIYFVCWLLIHTTVFFKALNQSFIFFEKMFSLTTASIKIKVLVWNQSFIAKYLKTKVVSTHNFSEKYIDLFSSANLCNGDLLYRRFQKRIELYSEFFFHSMSYNVYQQIYRHLLDRYVLKVFIQHTVNINVIETLINKKS